MSTKRIVDATVEAISLDQAKQWLRVDLDHEDTTIALLISAVRRSAEHEMQRTLMPATWELVRDGFPSALRLEYPRVIAVQSLKYLDETGVQQQLDPADFLVDADSEPGYVVPAFGKSWPATYGQINAVRVRYTAGYGSAAEIPASILLWMRLHLEHYYRNRGASVVGATVQPLPFADSLLDEGRVWQM